MPSQRILQILAALLAVGLCGLPVEAQKNSANKGAGTDAVQRPKTTTFDISKIVWPNPPAIARIKFENILTGQNVDWAGLEAKQKPKRSWMDRLAGVQPDAQIKDVEKKVGFQLIRVYGVASDSKGNIYAADQAVGAIFIFSRTET